MPRTALRYGETSDIAVTERERGGRRQWRARCSIGLYRETKKIETTSAISGDDARTKIQARVQSILAGTPRLDEPAAAQPADDLVRIEHDSVVAAVPAGQASPRPTVGLWVHLWLQDQQGVLEASSIRQYAVYVKDICPSRYPSPRTRAGTIRKGGLDRALIHDISGIDLTALTNGDVRRFLISLAQDGSVARPEHCASVLRRALDEAVSRGLIHTNPVRQISPWLASRLKAMRKGSRTLPALTPETAEMVTEALQGRELPSHSRLSDAWIVMIGSGLRIGEVLALRPQDYDPQRRTVTITGTLSDTPKLHRKDKTKSGDSGLVVEVSSAAANALDRALQQRRLDATAETIFTNRFGRLWSPSTFRTRFSKVVSEAGIEDKVTMSIGRPARISPHSARRTVGTWIANSPDGGVMQASQQLRHANTAITEARYVDRSAYVPQTRGVLDAFGS